MIQKVVINMNKIKKFISDQMYWIIPIVIVAGIGSCSYGLASKSWEAKQDREAKTLKFLKDQNCKQVEVIEPSDLMGLGLPQYRYQCDSNKAYTLNQDFNSGLEKNKNIKVMQND